MADSILRMTEPGNISSYTAAGARSGSGADADAVGAHAVDSDDGRVAKGHPPALPSAASTGMKKIPSMLEAVWTRCTSASPNDIVDF